MGQYVDGYVIPIKKTKIAAYKKLAKLGCKVWMDHGALHYYECIGDDIKNAWGLGFSKMCKLKAGETAIFAFVVYKSKAHRNLVNKKVMSDPRMKMDPSTKMPFEMNRFANGGFKVVVKSKK